MIATGYRVRVGLFDYGKVLRDAGNHGNTSCLEVLWDDGRKTVEPWYVLLPVC
jgi:hypothetical protein